MPLDPVLRTRSAVLTTSVIQGSSAFMMGLVLVARSVVIELLRTGALIRGCPLRMRMTENEL